MADPVATRLFFGNLFLDHLSERAANALKPSLASVALKYNEVVNDYETVSDRVLFPINSIISVVIDMANGATAEIGIIGREGMSGLAFVLGQASVNQRSIVQIPDSALSISAEAFRAAIEREPDLRLYALRYAQAVLTTSGQLSACNALHPLHERCARWLLMAQDRVSSDVLLLTQEFLGQMLGVRRATVALAQGELQQAGFISYARGHIKILNRAGLESVTCECYGAMDDGWKAIMGYNLRISPSATTPSAKTMLHPDGRRAT